MARAGARLIGLAVSLACAPAGAATSAAPASPTRAQLDTAAYHLKVLFSAMQSKDVAEPIKTILFACLYENPFEKISDATSRIVAANKLDAKDANKVLTVMAGVCGLGSDEGPKPKAGAPPQKPSR